MAETVNRDDLAVIFLRAKNDNRYGRITDNERRLAIRSLFSI